LTVGLIKSPQHGFRKSGSCLSNALEFLDEVTNKLDSYSSVDVIYLDFAKVFDNVLCLRLLDKLEKHGTGGNVLVWLKEWLSGRQQSVCVNGHMSSWKEVTSGVPQGSVLGPILFLVYINDLDSSLVSSVHKFADDTKLFGVVDNETHRRMLQKDLQRLCYWSEMWQMPFNASKCTVLHLGCHNNVFDYFMDNHKLDAVNVEKDLGIRITSNLKPASQCQQAYAKASKTLGIIARTI